MLAARRGLLFPSEYAIPLEAVDRYLDGTLVLKRTKRELLGDDV